jgi:hypothetical protein
MVQFWPAARVEPQVVVSAKSAGFVPPRVMPEMFSVALPVLERVVEMAVAVVPTVVLGKLSMVGERLATGAGAAVPFPLRVAVWGLPVALSATEMEAA